MCIFDVYLCQEKIFMINVLNWCLWELKRGILPPEFESENPVFLCLQCLSFNCEHHVNFRNGGPIVSVNKTLLESANDMHILFNDLLVSCLSIENKSH